MLGSGTLINLIVSLLLFASAVPGAAQWRAPASTRSPHGPLNTPCQNCHTLSGWKPIRNVPAFRSQSDAIPSSRHAPERGLHPVPHQAGFYNVSQDAPTATPTFISASLELIVHSATPSRDGKWQYNRSSSTRIGSLCSAHMPPWSATPVTRAQRPDSSRDWQRSATPATQPTIRTLPDPATCREFPHYVRAVPQHGQLVWSEI